MLSAFLRLKVPFSVAFHSPTSVLATAVAHTKREMPRSKHIKIRLCVLAVNDNGITKISETSEFQQRNTLFDKDSIIHCSICTFVRLTKRFTSKFARCFALSDFKQRQHYQQQNILIVRVFGSRDMPCIMRRIRSETAQAQNTL